MWRWETCRIMYVLGISDTVPIDPSGRCITRLLYGTLLNLRKYFPSYQYTDKIVV